MACGNYSSEEQKPHGLGRIVNVDATVDAGSRDVDIRYESTPTGRKAPRFKHRNMGHPLPGRRLMNGLLPLF
jgi:hypothetical protein